MECRGPKEKNKGGAAHQGLKAALALLLVLSSSIIADAQEKPDAAAGIYSVSRGALYAGAGLDLATTLRGYRSHRTETNPLIRNLPGNRYVTTSAVVLGTAAAADLATKFLKAHGHPRLAVISNFCLGGLHIYAGVHNMRNISAPGRSF